jgi:hypothetical protein
MELVHRVFDRKDLILQIAVAFDSRACYHTRMLGGYQTFFFKVGKDFSCINSYAPEREMPSTLETVFTSMNKGSSS